MSSHFESVRVLRSLRERLFNVGSKFFDVSPTRVVSTSTLNGASTPQSRPMPAIRRENRDTKGAQGGKVTSRIAVWKISQETPDPHHTHLSLFHARDASEMCVET